VEWSDNSLVTKFPAAEKILLTMPNVLVRSCFSGVGDIFIADGCCGCCAGF